MFADVDPVLAAIDSFVCHPKEFILFNSDALQDPAGINMAIITDRVLARGRLPAGSEQKEGFRLYGYSGQDDVEI